MMGGEVEFPEDIIQRIQSLLTGKEAARTTILSKSWHRAWLTRPNLDLDDSRFEYGFCEYAKQTIKRYQQSNLKIERFKLLVAKNCSCDIAEKLIAKALAELGDNLVELSVKGCGIDLDGIALKCCRLESLCLDSVGIQRDELYNLFSSCPLIEKLSLFNFRCYGQQRGPVNTHLDRLRCLVLCYESFEALFPGDSLSKLPFLKDFTLLNLRHSCLQRREEGLDVQISNCSLENVKIVLENEENSRGWRSDDVRLKVKLDVPNIRKFTFEGGDIMPELCFVSSSSTTATTEWESHVSFANYLFGSLFWFHELNTFLTQLRQSKIHLSLVVESTYACCDYRIGDLSVARKLELESLTIDLTSLPSFTCNALLDGLFRLCRPKLITHQIQKKEDVDKWKENVHLLWHAFEQGMHVSIPRQLMYGLKGLEEVNAQVFEDEVWRPLLFQEQADQQKQQTIRFLLKWRPS